MFEHNTAVWLQLNTVSQRVGSCRTQKGKGQCQQGGAGGFSRVCFTPHPSVSLVCWRYFADGALLKGEVKASLGEGAAGGGEVGCGSGSGWYSQHHTIGCSLPRYRHLANATFLKGEPKASLGQGGLGGQLCILNTIPQRSLCHGAGTWPTQRLRRVKPPCDQGPKLQMMTPPASSRHRASG